MFGSNDVYNDAIKNARINMYDSREVSIKMWFINFTLFSLLLMVSYYSYIYFNSSKSHPTIVMGVNHINTSDNDLMVKLYDIEVDRIAVEKDNVSIAKAMKKIIDDSSINSSVKDNSKYVEELALEVDVSTTAKEKKTTFEKQISDELKLIN